MKTRMISTTSKPAEPTCIFNGMLAAKEQALEEGPAYGLQFANHLALRADTLSAAPVGFANSQYTTVSQLHDLDPTSLMAVSRVAAEHKLPSGTVGYTHLHTEHSYRLAVSAQFAKWYLEYCTLFELALSAETEMKTGRTNLSDLTDVSYGEGAVEAFLMATGDITGREFGYGPHDPVDVKAIYDQTISMLTPWVSTLDHYGFDLGMNLAKTSTGIGTIPVAQEAVAFLPASTMDGLFRSPWRVAMRNPRARNMLKDAFISRIPAKVCSKTFDSGSDSAFRLVEGDDAILIPTWLADTPEGVFDAMALALDALGPLSDSDYSRPSSWTDQFRSMGEVARAIFVDDDLDIRVGGPASSFAVNDWIRVIGSSAAARPAPQGEIVGTGPLYSVSSIRDYSHPIYNTISGSTTVRFNTVGDIMAVEYADENANGDPVTVVFPEDSGMVLPNGIMYLGTCANATAVDWFVLLRWMNTAWSPELREISRLSRHDRNTLPNSSIVRVKDSVSMIANLSSASQRNGIQTPVFASFNVQRPLREGQQGPAFLTNGTDLTQQLMCNAGEWDLNDSSEIVSWTTTLGRDIKIPATNFAGIPSRFTGNMDANRAPANWVPQGIPDSNAIGSKDLEMQIAHNLMSWPLKLDGLTADNAGHGSFTGVVDAFTPTLSHAIATGGPRMRFGAIQNTHPEFGFMRGYYHVTPESAFASAGLSNPKLGAYLRLDSVIAVHDEGGDGTSASSMSSSNKYKLGKGGANGAYEDAVSDMSEFYTLTLADDDAAVRSGYLWDPTRSQIVGTGWYQWGGVLYMDATFSPYQQSLISVATGATTVDNLQPNHTPHGMALNSVDLMSSVDDTWTLAAQTEFSYVQVSDAASGDDRVEGGIGCGNSLITVNSLQAAPTYVSRLAAEDHNSNFAGTHITGGNIYGAPGTGVATTCAHVPQFSRAFSVTNSCGRNKTNAATCMGLNSSNGVYIGQIVFPNVAPQLHSCYSGEQAVDMASFDQRCALIIGGEGLVPDHDLTKDVLNPYHWLMRTYLDVSDQPSATLYPLGDLLADGVRGVDPVPVTAHLPSQTSVAASSRDTPSGHAGLELSNKGDIFSARQWWDLDANGRYDGILSRRRAKMRTDLDTPWARIDSKSSGIVHLRPESRLVASKISTEFLPKLKALGSALVTGLDNDMFRKIQIRA